MSTENTPDDTDETSLDDFSAEFFGQTKADPEPTKPEVEEEVTEEVDANTNTQDDSDTDDDDTDDSSDQDTEDEDNEEEEQEEEAPAPKPKKNRFQERIDELTTARREAEREAAALQQRLAALEAKLNGEQTTPAPTQKVANEGPTPPTPVDINEDGSEKYPLGEFDPQFITDLADFRVEQKLAQREQQQAEQVKQRELEEVRSQLEENWNGQLDTARERYPDFDEKGENLSEVFVDIDPAYGEYLGATLMSMDKGADVLYYLANNPDVAREIVNSGAQRATIALGRLEAQFVEQESPPATRKRATSAPPPPPQTRGSATARGRVAPDTDDLDAFSETFFNKK